MHINTTCLHRWTSQKQWNGFPCAKEQRKRKENVHSSETPSGLSPTHKYGKIWKGRTVQLFLLPFLFQAHVGNGERQEGRKFPRGGTKWEREKETEFSLSSPPQFFLPPPEPDTHFPPPSLKISSLFPLFLSAAFNSRKAERTEEEAVFSSGGEGASSFVFSFPVSSSSVNGLLNFP